MEPEALDYFCRACDGVRIHILSENNRYHCGVCDRSVSAVEVATNYSAEIEDDLMVIIDPYRSRALTAAEKDDTMEGFVLLDE